MIGPAQAEGKALVGHGVMGIGLGKTLTNTHGAGSKAVKGNVTKDRPGVNFNTIQKDSLPRCCWIPDVSFNDNIPDIAYALCYILNGPWYSSLEHGQAPMMVPKGQQSMHFTCQPDPTSMNHLPPSPMLTTEDARTSGRSPVDTLSK